LVREFVNIFAEIALKIPFHIEILKDMKTITAILCLILCPIVLLAADKKKGGPVYTNPEMVDDDYAFQGEYRGYQSSNRSARNSESIGLQVISKGNGTFEATKYYGGLPGAGWTGGERFALSGERSGDRLILIGEQYDIEIIQQHALIVTKDGKSVGTLKRIQRTSPTMGATPPPGAIVLFNGSDTERFVNGKMTPEGNLQAGTVTADAYGDFRLHAEFRLPYKPEGVGQDRGNSGFYLQSRYEVQVLDTFGLEGVENHCGALYRTRRPDFNMCLPPLQWQTYDIDFTSPKFDANGKKIANMRISVWHNGALIHNNVEIPHKTGAGQQEGPDPLPTKLQDHGNPVVYRNMWIIDKTNPTAASQAWIDVPVKMPPVPVTSYQLPSKYWQYGQW